MLNFVLGGVCVLAVEVITVIGYVVVSRYIDKYYRENNQSRA